ncbi:Fic family protein [Dyadobacter sandarakinus]|uniref:Fic family protein n=1 Tax=Dyadobacter sandarakinus TaxID=2747268 RepID=A0ABX7I7J3_9BACT|nr:Fic family protein [Dyadobacter sandarakinus]QRR02064.1 Fic family protein [Dyadobacter sandarakinus]
MPQYIYQKKDWPAFKWDTARLSPMLAELRFVQGKIIGQMNAMGFSVRSDAVLKTLTQDVLKSTEIEGEILNPEQVRSSIARRLGLDAAGLIPADRNVEGVVEMMLDATQNYTVPLTKDRLFGWQSSLFPSGRSGMYQIMVGKWRDNEKGPMQVVSGPMGRETVHFEAPDASMLDTEMQVFLDWFNTETTIDPIIKSGIAHLWFVTLHPFDDGNGRIARAIADMQLARAEDSPERFYSMSAQIRQQRSEYYSILEKTQKGTLDITEWLKWYLACMRDAMKHTEETSAAVVKRVQFWDKHAETPMSDRQRRMINRMQEDFVGKLTSSKWAKMMKCSQDTASRDIQDLVTKGILEKEAAGGRSTNYRLII